MKAVGDWGSTAVIDLNDLPFRPLEGLMVRDNLGLLQALCVVAIIRRALNVSSSSKSEKTYPKLNFKQVDIRAPAIKAWNTEWLIVECPGHAAVL